MEHMVHSESEKYKNELLSGLKNKFGDKLNEEELKFIVSSFDKYIFDMIKLMRDGKSAHEKFFSDIILYSVDGILGYNPDNKIFLWNKGAEKIFGLSKEEMTDKDISLVINKHSFPNRNQSSIQNELNTFGFVSNVEIRVKDKDENLKDISMSQHLIYDDKGEKLGTVAILRDITKEKKLEKELREKENLALIGQIVSSIAHNLSNPLNIISGNADYLLLEKKKEDEGYEELQVIIEETTRITKSIRQLLNFARPIAPMREVTDFNELVQDAISGFKYLTSNKNIKLKFTPVKNISKIKVDKELFKDVILNFISNSVQAIHSDKEGLIEIKIHTEKKYSVFEISDNGSGISNKDLPNIFKPFYSTKGYGKGTGLGLAFTDRVIKEHNGIIKINSSEGNGTTFIVKIPSE